MTTPEPWTVGDTPPSPGSHLIASAALNADIEVEQYVQLPDDKEPSVSDPTTVRRSFLPPAHYSLAVCAV